MTLLYLLPCAFGLLSMIEMTVAAKSVLTRRVLERSYGAAKLSALAYAVFDPKWQHYWLREFLDYDEIHFYTDEPNQAIRMTQSRICLRFPPR